MARNFLAVLLLLVLVVGSEAAPIKLGSRYRDESNGFQIQIPEKWDQVPTRFQEVALVAKWNGREKRGNIAPALFILRFLQPKQAPVTPGAAPEPGKAVPPGYEDMIRMQEKKNVWEYVEQFVPEHDITENDPDFKLSTKGLVAHLRVYREKVRGDPNDRRLQEFQTLIVAAEIRTVEPSEVTYGVAYGCAAADEENMMSAFKTSIKRFKILQPGEEDVDEEDSSADSNIFIDSEKKPEAWRKARKKKLEGLKDWDALDTEHYLIVYNKEVKRPLLKQIANHIELIRAEVYEKLFPPTHEVKAVSVVRVCKDAEEYHRYGGPGGSAGYWADSDEELVFYQDKANRTDSLRVLYHEAFHQYIYYAVGNVAPHSWFNEGHGDYFAGHDCVGGKFIAKPFRWRTGIIADAFGQKSWVPLDKFLKYTQGEYYSNPGLCYAQGWSFIYFLREVERRKIVKYKKYWGLLDRYFEAIKRNVKTVKEGGLEGLNDPPAKPPDGGPPTPPDGGTPPPDGEGTKPPDGTPPGPGGPEVGTPAPPPEGPTVKGRDLPSLPGLELPFPGEHPEAGAAESASKSGEGGTEGPKAGERKTIAGPRINDEDSALNAAVDEVFLKNKEIDIKELEKDWVEWSK